MKGQEREVEINHYLIERHVSGSKLLSKAYEALMSDEEYNALVEMSNVMAVKRLKYNDHGPVHAKIVAGASLEIFRRIVMSGVKPSTMVEGTSTSIDESMLVVMLGAFLHDVGNSVHRQNHEEIGALLAKDLVDRVLEDVLDASARRRIMLRQEILHIIYSTSFDVESLTVEAGSVKIGDGVDMSKGRARYPYKMGKNDIHAISALSIDKVTISTNSRYPVVIKVFMNERAGVFQLEKILIPKIRTSGLRSYVDLKPIYNGKEMRIEY